jgi:hypothetical protein
MRLPFRASRAEHIRRAVLGVLISLTAVCSAYAENRQPGALISAPVLPIPATIAVRQPVQLVSGVRAEAVPPSAPTPPGGSLETVLIPLAPGLSMISIPVETTSDVLSDLMPNLPDGSRVWTWSAADQQFVEGFDGHLPFGQGCLLYVPQPTILSITGQPTDATATPVELTAGWNLVGVPSTSALPLAGQTVYVDYNETTISDAMDSGGLGPSITTLGTHGYINIVGSDNETLESAHSYWIYSDGNAELLQLQKAPLLSFDPTFGQWFASQLGQAGLKWALGTAYDNLNPNSTQNQLSQIRSDLAQVKDTINKVSGQVTSLATAVATSEANIKINIQESRLDPAKQLIEDNYDKDVTSDSFMFFASHPEQATAKLKLAYSLKVLQKFDTEKKFGSIRDVILGNKTPGIMNQFADLIVLNNAARPNSTLKDRYDAMGAYFNELIGWQIKLGTMVKGAYDTVVKADPGTLPPDYAVASNAADVWEKKFEDTMATEYQAFRATVERIAASRVIHASRERPRGAPSSWLDAQTEVMLGKLDWLMMNALGEAQGLRVRVMVSPDMNPNNTYFIGSATGDRIPLPSTDSGTWTPVTVTTLPAGVSASYDSWRIRLADSVPEFTASNSWLVYRTAGLSLRSVYVRDKFALLEPFSQQVFSQYYDKNFQRVRPNTDGATLFGSYTMVSRASAQQMLQFCGINPTVVWLNPSNQTSACSFALHPTICGTVEFSRTGECGGAPTFRREQRFGYFGAASNGNVIVYQTASGCPQSYRDNTKNIKGTYQASIYDSSNNPVIFSSFRGFASEVSVLTAPVQWKPGTYVYTVDMRPAGCAGTFTYRPGPVVMTFSP